MVKPYVYEFRTHAKERWYQRELLAVFIKEFGANSPEYYVRCVSVVVLRLCLPLPALTYRLLLAFVNVEICNPVGTHHDEPADRSA